MDFGFVEWTIMVGAFVLAVFNWFYPVESEWSRRLVPSLWMIATALWTFAARLWRQKVIR